MAATTGPLAGCWMSTARRAEANTRPCRLNVAPRQQIGCPVAATSNPSRPKAYGPSKVVPSPAPTAPPSRLPVHAPFSPTTATTTTTTTKGTTSDSCCCCCCCCCCYCFSSTTSSTVRSFQHVSISLLLLSFPIPASPFNHLATHFLLPCFIGAMKTVFHFYRHFTSSSMFLRANATVSYQVHACNISLP